MSDRPPPEDGLPDESLPEEDEAELNRPITGDLPSLAVRRPILTIVANLLIIIGGLAALSGVEVRELPDVDRPIVTVRAIWDGASPETMDTEVTSVLEGAVARVSGVRSIRSGSEENNMRVRVEFEPDTDLDTAANDVREAVAGVERRLPDGVEEVSVVKADDNAGAVIRISAISDSLSEEELTKLAEEDISTEIASVPGVATVEVFGSREKVMRVLVEPLRLSSYGLTIDDVAQVLESARFDVPAGSFRSDDQLLIVRADASVWQPDEVESLEIAPRVRLGDVGNVVYGPADAENSVRLDGRTVVGLGVIRQARSNTIEISEGVDREIARLNRSLDGVEIIKTSDDAIFIKGSVREVLISLGLAVVIVIAVTFVFLGALRPTLIPATTIPVALIGTVAGIWLMGFSVNILTLLAMVLATGMIVDDAIVVMENIQRRKAQGLRPLAAAVLGTRQVFFAVLATTATLISVFLPIAFLPSTAGRLFTEFGFVLAVAVAISSFVALTLCPMLASRLPAGGQDLPVVLRRIGSPMAGLYRRMLDATLAVPLLVIAGVAILVALAVLQFASLDEELVPSEDRGTIIIAMQGPDGVDLPYMERQVAPVEAALAPLRAEGLIQNVFTIVGRYDLNRAFITVTLVPWEERETGQAEIVRRLQQDIGQLPGATVRIFGTNSLNLRGASSGGLEFALTGTSYPAIAAAAADLIAAATERLPQLRDMRMDYQATQPQLSVKIDRRRAEDLGIPVEGIAATLRAMVDGYEVTEISLDDTQVPVILQSTGGAINDPGDLANLYVRSADDRMIPLTAFISITEEGVPAELDRVGQKRAVEMDAGLAPNVPLRQAIADLEALADEVLPGSIGIVWQGEAATLEETSQEVAITFAIAVLVVLLVLAAQFESFLSALVIILTVPSGIAAALFALALTGTSLNIYSQIGLVMLIGLMAKNGILIVEFADQLRDRGLPVHRAIREASLVRLRPVMMTMLSTVFGALPLILAAGPGAEARTAIGWVIFGGLGIATFFTLFLTPAVYRVLAPLTRPRADAQGRLKAEMEAARSRPDRLSGGGDSAAPAPSPGPAE
ncbi:efflux RND transporter permease subunit [Marinibaculum pumilum]|uniref:Efflux RND transporter permease subunit n=1 Tax=Marinibaculum pumilum TaxID=1766165 RepID=A0ABV7L8Z3_9PROT